MPFEIVITNVGGETYRVGKSYVSLIGDRWYHLTEYGPLSYKSFKEAIGEAVVHELNR